MAESKEGKFVKSDKWPLPWKEIIGAIELKNEGAQNNSAPYDLNWDFLALSHMALAILPNVNQWDDSTHLGKASKKKW